MNSDTQKTWTLRLTPENEPATTLEGLPHEQMATLIWKTIHGFGPIEQLAADIHADARNDDQLVAA